MSFIDLATPAPFVAVVSLARPPVNALNRQARQELIQVISSLQHREDVRAIVLTAQGHVFCAGADIKEKGLLSESNSNQTEANRLTRDVFFSLLESRKPIIGAINGAALGAGFVLASCCDVILAAEEAVFAMPEIDVGQGGGASFLQRILPRLLMRKMMLTGERVSSAELHRLGVVDRCLPVGELLGAAVELAALIAAKSPVASRTIRESFVTVESLPISEGFRLEQRYTSELSASPDAHEARQAFLEKRPASY